MIKDRAKDTKRSVGSHQEMMGALGRATGWEKTRDFSRKGQEIIKPGAGHVKTGKIVKQKEFGGKDLFYPGMEGLVNG